MRICFVSAGDIEWGSSRMRCYWPAEYMGADIVTFDEAWRHYKAQGSRHDVYIFQKHADVKTIRKYREEGSIVFWDACDPSWWFSPRAVRAILEEVDGVVCSNESLTVDLIAWMEENGIDDENELLVTTIPDRLELSHFPLRREHRDSNPVRLIWYGMAQNRVTIYAALANLDRLVANGYPIELTVMDNEPKARFQVSDNFPIYHIPWSLGGENEIIANHDIALLGHYPGPWGRVKSNNRQLTAWACGLPTTTGADYREIRELVKSAGFRRELAVEGMDTLHAQYDVKATASEWLELIDRCA